MAATMAATRPVWAEVSLSRLAGNYRLLRARAAVHAGDLATPPHLLPVVKANAYGHGLDLCGPALAAAGASWLGVTSVQEGAALRRAHGVLPPHLAAARILIMSSLWEGEADTVLDRALTPLVWEPYQLQLLHAAADARGCSPGSVPVHFEIDTGMARQGVAPGPALAALLAALLPGTPLAIEGVMTHFSAPDELAVPDTDLQLTRFAAALDQLAATGVRPRVIHAGNSATVFDAHHARALATLAASYPASDGEPALLLLRPGLALYGYPVRFTPPALAPAQAGLQPVLAWKTRITSLRTLAPGEGAGYNSIFRAARSTRLALVPVGYADGLNRLLSNPASSFAGAMLVRAHRAPIAGRISMDQTMLDVTDIPGAAIGDEVAILGEQGAAAIDAWEHADACGTIPYEVLCNIAARVPRVAVE